jgi:hypothetical protein
MVVRKPPWRWMSNLPYSGSARTSAICCGWRSSPTRPASVLPVPGQRVLVEVGAVLLGEGARRDRQPVRVALEQEDQGDVGPAEVAGAVDDALQHGVEVRGGAAEDGQHPARRRLLLSGLAEVAPEALDLLAQPPRGPNVLHHLDSLEDIPFSQD